MLPERQKHLDDVALGEIVAGTAGEIGEAFFAVLVKHLARALGTRCAWVTEYLPQERRLRALSFWVGDHYQEHYEYDVAGTPCEAVIAERRLVHVPQCVIDLYPRDPDLAPLGAVAYMGIPLLDDDGELLGHLAVLHDAPLPEDVRATAVFRIFAARASAELRRLRRDRDLAEREQRLSGLVASALDAIIQLDDEMHVVHLNPAARKVFACGDGEAAGASFARFLAPDSFSRLVDLVTRLRGPSLWIPDGLQGRRANGELFAAEASLSRFELGGRPRYTLILRDVDERLAAAARIRRLLDETEALRAELDDLQGFDEIIGESPALRRVLADLERVAGTDTTVLVTGETGTGKELIARALHQRSARRDGPLVKVNCAAIAANLQESEFFGHERGAFTGATQRRDGRFKLADRGTIFLDEVGELPLDLQAKLLRVLQEGEFEPVGGTRTLKVDVRVVAATNRDLEEMVAAGRFRRDLLYRLNVFPLHVPPLRERGDDVVLLAQSFLARLALRQGLVGFPLTPDDAARLRRYDWPGNVRELQNVIERAFITSRDRRRLDLDRALPDAPGATPAPASPTDGRILTAGEMRDLERANLLRALAATRWKIAGREGAAARLGLNPNTLSSRLKALGITRPAE